MSSYTNPPTYRMITCPNTVKYSEDGSTATIDLRALASQIPPDHGDSFYFPITIPRNILSEPESEEESESDDEPEISKIGLKKLDKTLAGLTFDLDRVVRKAYRVLDFVKQMRECSSSSSSSSDYASSDENEKFVNSLPSPPPLTRQVAIAISSDEEESVTVADDLPLAPGRYKKQF